MRLEGRSPRSTPSGRTGRLHSHGGPCASREQLQKLADAILDCRERYQQQPGESEEAFLARLDAMPEDDKGLLLLGLLGPPRTPETT